MTKLKVVQCWDDGVTKDRPLIEILRKYDAKATFNLNPGLHQKTSIPTWVYKETQVGRLGLDEMPELYQGFVIANHTVSHPHLENLPAAEARAQIVDGRKQLQDMFQQEVRGFAFPFGTYNDETLALLREAGHAYGRTVRNEAQCFPPEDPMAFHSTCHFLCEDFWDRYEKAKEGGVFYFWGHSYEMINDEMWSAFDAKIARISADSEAEWLDVIDLFPES